MTYIVTKSPMRISFLGGGSDLNFFLDSGGEGNVICTSIDKFVYVVIKNHDNFSESIRLSYFNSESVNAVESIQNMIIKESLKELEIERNVYISTSSDLPHNLGLGSSSAFQAALILGLAKFKNREISQSQLFNICRRVESRINSKIFGIQDLAATIYGGFNHFRFHNKLVERINLDKAFISSYLKRVCLLLVSDRSSSSSVIDGYNTKNLILYQNLSEIAKIYSAKRLTDNSITDFNIDVQKSWEMKLKLSNYMASKDVIKITQKLEQLGINTFKLLGAGSSGTIMFYSDNTSRDTLKNELSPFVLIDSIKPEFGGTQVILND
jgi:D-glycero-alpha-D-manno-heptose-7-phosphate kinase